MMLVVVLGTIFAASFFSGAESREAKVLLKVTDNKTYELVEDVLEELSKIERPIRVFAAVGNARVGKSTMLNLVTHVWDGWNKIKKISLTRFLKPVIHSNRLRETSGHTRFIHEAKADPLFYWT